MLIVDDGSVDGTKRVAFDFVKKYTVDNVRIILLGRNHGKGEAIRKVSLSYKIHLICCELFYKVEGIPLLLLVQLLI